MTPIPRKNLVAVNLLALGVCATVALVYWLAFDALPAAGIPADTQPRQPMSLVKQWLVVLTAFGVKPFYLLVSLGVVLWLWRQRSPDLTALRWGLIWFWAGEQSCTVNWLLYAGASEGWEYLHNFGMVAGFAFVFWAVMEGVDGRLIHFSAENERCTALALCRRCSKYADEPCGFRRVFLITVPAAAVLALLPLTAGFKLTSYGANVLGAAVCYSHSPASQWFELRLCPALALACFAVAWLGLCSQGKQAVSRSKLFFAAGLGPLSFGLMRMSLVATFSNDLMWFEAWEEWTELLFVLSVVCLLWTFRHGLFANDSTAHNDAPATL